MQATLSTRHTAQSKNLIDIAPRKQQPAERYETRTSRDQFTSKLADARADRANRADETDKPTTTAQDVAATSKPKDVERENKVDKAGSSGDAATQSDESAKAKTPATAKPEETSATDDDAEEVTAESEKPKVAKLATDEQKKLEAALISSQAAPQAAQVDKPKDASEASNEKDVSPDAVAIAAAGLVAATTATDDQTKIAGDGEQAASAQTSPVDATLVKKATDDDGKPKLQTIDAKSASAKLTADTDAVVPTQANAKHEHTSDQEAGKQQDAQLAATDAPSEVAKVDLKKSADSAFDAMLAKLMPSDVDAPKQLAPTPTVTTPQPPTTAEARFAADNVDNVVKNVHSEIAAGGNGQMRIRLDPPELGALEVQIKMIDGRMSAAFTTSNDDATRLLSHNLNNLKSSLEASGINVDRIQVRQSTTDNDAQQQPGSGEHRRDGSHPFDQPSQRGDQQRKDAVEKMWRKLAYGSDEFDFVA